MNINIEGLKKKTVNFCDLHPGQIFESELEMFYLKIDEITAFDLKGHCLVTFSPCDLVFPLNHEIILSP